MASNLRVDNIQPSTGTGIGIGTANGSVTITGDLSVDTSKGLTVGTGATINGSTNTITASTNGSERLRIDSSGHIGIGTDNPESPLHVVGTVAASPNKMGFHAGGYGGYGQITLVGEPGEGSFIDFNETGDPGDYKARVIYFNSDDTFRLYANGNNERVRITSGGNVNITNGNLVFSTSGTGIDFSATANSSGTTTSELLDDYEEGTWTPTVLSAGSIGTPQYNCTYTKIGRLVTINADLHQISDITSATTIQIGGLPYVPSGSSGEWSAICMGERYDVSLIIAFLQNDGAWKIRFRNGVGSANYTDIAHSSINNATDNNLRFTLTYEAL